MEMITSQQNKWVKHCKKLNKRKYREVHQEYLLEGHHLVQEALTYAPEKIKQLFATKKAMDSMLKKPSADLFLISEEVSQSISATKSAQGIFAIMEIPTTSEAVLQQGAFVILDGVQDPGNVGTIIRTADAAGYTGVILGLGSADLYNDKVLRSMQGSHFHLPVFQVDLLTTLAQLKQQNFVLYGTQLDPSAKNYREVTASGNYAIILGNEGQGVSQEVLELMDQTVYIPILGSAESLNVAVAGGILMYHFKQND